jgi:hypothetical protein
VTNNKNKAKKQKKVSENFQQEQPEVSSKPDTSKDRFKFDKEKDMYEITYDF